MKYLELFRNEKEIFDNIINHLDLCLDNIIKTRNSKLRDTSSCRLWQFKFILLYIYNQINKNKIVKNINKIETISEDLL